jgi:hypothetical protein
MRFDDFLATHYERLLGFMLASLLAGCSPEAVQDAEQSAARRSDQPAETAAPDRQIGTASGWDD